MAATTTPHRNPQVTTAQAPRRSSLPLGLVTAGIVGLALQVTLPSCSIDLGSLLDSNRTCGAQLAESLHRGAANAERVLDSAACRVHPR